MRTILSFFLCVLSAVRSTLYRSSAIPHRPNVKDLFSKRLLVLFSPQILFSSRPRSRVQCHARSFAFLYHLSILPNSREKIIVMWDRVTQNQASSAKSKKDCRRLSLNVERTNLALKERNQFLRHWKNSVIVSWQDWNVTFFSRTNNARASHASTIIEIGKRESRGREMSAKSFVAVTVSTGIIHFIDGRKAWSGNSRSPESSIVYHYRCHYTHTLPHRHT